MKPLRNEIVVVGLGDGAEVFLRRCLDEGYWWDGEVWSMGVGLCGRYIPGPAEELILKAIICAKRVWVYGLEMGESFKELKRIADVFECDLRFQVTAGYKVEGGQWHAT